MSQIVSLTANANQTNNVSLQVDGKNLKLRLSLSFNSMAGYWSMDIADQFGNALVVGIPLLTGDYPAANLLCQQRYLAIGACYIINFGQVAADHPDATNLGTDFLLLWDDTPTI